MDINLDTLRLIRMAMATYLVETSKTDSKYEDMQSFHDEVDELIQLELKGVVTYKFKVLPR